MFTKILVPIAFSKYSQGILRFAASLAVPLGAELRIANVVNERDLEAVERIASFGYKVDGDHYIKTIQKERVEKLDAMLAEIDFPEEKYSFTFLAGDPTTELLKLVITEDIDLVLMGTKNKEIKHIFTGSVAERMFRKCPVSVISYRGGDIAAGLTKRIKKEMAKK
jgi:nucleotide-binding universal stress UspA family protein